MAPPGGGVERNWFDLFKDQQEVQLYVGTFAVLWGGGGGGGGGRGCSPPFF